MSLGVEHRLPRTSPERQGVDSTAILAFVEALESQIHEVHSLMLLRHGSVIAEGWWSPYAPEHSHLMFSVSKSFTSTAIGLAINEGHLSLDDSVVSFFPEEAPDEVSEFLASMRVRHLLSMSSGQAVDTWSYMVDRVDGHWIKGFLSVTVVHIPGTHFVYNTGATFLLSAILQKATGMKLLDYLQTRLFEPLGIENATWQDAPQGITAGGIGLSIKTEDLARFGQLYLQKGMWHGIQVLPEAWVEQATTRQIANGDDPTRDWTQGYGYQFWRCRHGAYRGDGVFGQFCVVMPEQDAVLVLTGGMDVFDMQQPLNLVWEMLLPAMQSTVLPDNADAWNRLQKKLSELSFAPVHGQRTSPIAPHVSGRTYHVDANALNIERLTLHFNEEFCTLTLYTDTEEETILVGYGTWQKGQTARFEQPLLFKRTPVATSAAWTSDVTLTMIMRLYETPFFYTLAFHFADDELMIEIQVNVSLESMTPLLLTARLTAPTSDTPETPVLHPVSSSAVVPHSR